MSKQRKIKTEIMNNVRTAVIAVVLIIVLAATIGGCGAKKTKEAIVSAEQLNDPAYTIGVGVGSASQLKAEKAFPKAEILYYSNDTLGYHAVSKNKIDAYVFEKLLMQEAINSGLSDVRLLDDTIGENVDMAVGISPVTKIPDFENRLNAFIAGLKADGTLDDMIQRWVIGTDRTMPAIDEPSEPTTKLTVATSGIAMPFTYYEGTMLTGFDIELAKRFALYLDASLEFKVYDYDAIIASAKTGDSDCIMAELNVTPERAESIGFSDILLSLETGVMVYSPGGSAPGSGSGQGTENDANDGFIAVMIDSFNKTFIRENRWRLFLSGIGTTLLITVMSITFGTVLGELAYLLCRRGNSAVNRLTAIFIRLINGLPVIVLLMILYYVVFGELAVSGVTVAIVGFTLIFAAEVIEMLKAGVATVDRGQYEAACTLGFSDLRAFFRIILPQALPHMIPIYKTHINSLIKATAVVGYIAVQDITKMGDIVRSRTYQAFFPLIAVAIIYFILAYVFLSLINRINISFDPKTRKDIPLLRGVNTDD